VEGEVGWLIGEMHSYIQSRGNLWTPDDYVMLLNMSRSLNNWLGRGLEQAEQRRGSSLPQGGRTLPSLKDVIGSLHPAGHFGQMPAIPDGPGLRGSVDGHGAEWQLRPIDREPQLAGVDLKRSAELGGGGYVAPQYSEEWIGVSRSLGRMGPAVAPLHSAPVIEDDDPARLGLAVEKHPWQLPQATFEGPGVVREVQAPPSSRNGRPLQSLHQLSQSGTYNVGNSRSWNVVARSSTDGLLGGDPVGERAVSAEVITSRHPHQNDKPLKTSVSLHSNPKECEDCGTTVTPEWRRGPSGRKSLCNACGLRFFRRQAKANKPKD